MPRCVEPLSPVALAPSSCAAVSGQQIPSSSFALFGSQRCQKRLTAVEALDHPWLTGQAPTEPIKISVLRSLKDFNSTNKLKTLVVSSMLKHLQDHEVHSLKATFAAMDKDQDGTVTRAELQSVSLRAGTGSTQTNVPTACAQALQQVAQSQQGLAEEFKSEDVTRILNAADVDGDGRISKRLASSSLQGRSLLMWCRLPRTGHHVPHTQDQREGGAALQHIPEARCQRRRPLERTGAGQGCGRARRGFSQGAAGRARH